VTFETIQITERRDRIGIITLNRPDKRNAISIQMRQELSTCLNQWKRNDAVGAVIITGAGKAFTAGFDLSEFKKTEALFDLYHTSSQYHRDVWYFPKPIIAAVNGQALAGGFDLAKLCDIRICTETAQFGHPEIKFGAPTLYTPLKWIVGDGLARDLCLSGRVIDGREAYRIGLVNEVVDAEQLLDRAIEISLKILEAPDSALKTTKKFFTAHAALGFEESFSIEHDKAFQEFLLEKAVPPKRS
jgi:enoyl-CoA hydratase/carnithine racemase